jgi:Kdo2-lipid IVA lauroyltransferase/acyltransferase
MKIWRQIRKVGEAVLVCLGMLFIPFLPRTLLVSLARSLGNAAFRLSGKLRRIALANLDVAFGSSLTTGKKEAIARESFQTFALVVLDLFWFSVFSNKRISARCRFDKSFYNYLDRAPVVAVTGHFGNWEVMGQAASLVGKGPLGPLSVATPLDNAFVDWMLRRWRRNTGQGIVKREGAIKTVIKLLRKGGRVALLMDQNTLPEEGGVFVSFFGLPVPVSKAAFAMAAWTDSDIVPAYCLLEEHGMRYVAYGSDPIKVDRQADNEEKITQAVTRAMEDIIRRNPGHWLWMYKRWKYIPPGAPGEKYPFYARKYEKQEKK